MLYVSTDILVAAAPEIPRPRFLAGISPYGGGYFSILNQESPATQNLVVTKFWSGHRLTSEPCWVPPSGVPAFDSCRKLQNI